MSLPILSLPVGCFARPLRLASLCLTALLGLPVAAEADPHQAWGRHPKHHHAQSGWQHGWAGHDSQAGRGHHRHHHDCDGPDEVVVYRRSYVPPARSGWGPVRGGYGRPGRSGVDVDGTIVIRIGS